MTDDLRTGLALAMARNGGNQPDVKSIDDVLWKEDYLRYADAALSQFTARLASEDMVERLARSICRARYMDPDDVVGTAGRKAWQDYIKAARAVIAAQVAAMGETQ